MRSSTVSLPMTGAERSAFATDQKIDSDDTPRLLSKDVMADILSRVRGLVRGDGETSLGLDAWWRGELRWARNRVSVASDRRDYLLSITRVVDGAYGSMDINQLDDVSLERAVRAAEFRARYTWKRSNYSPMPVSSPVLPYPDTAIWSDSTYNATVTQRRALVRTLTQGAEAQGMLSAGYIEMRGSEQAFIRFGSREDDRGTSPLVSGTTRPVNADPLQANGHDLSIEGGRVRLGDRAYSRHTQAQCSMTVRHPKGTGSGWAGLSGYDWSVIDGGALADRALQKCVASLNPVAIEPGRYTVILDAQAVSQLVEILWASFIRGNPENGYGPFVLEHDRALQLWRTKLGLKVIDERITLSHDPLHPALGVVPQDGLGFTTWIERGILQSLDYRRDYALAALNENLGALRRTSYHMSGGSTTAEEMITSTKRGLLVTRFSSVSVLDKTSLLSTGLTRDGLWLVENGTITKAVKNMRFTDSPLFVLNRVDQLGVPVPVFHPREDGLAPCIVPPIKADDFSFTSTIDAV